MSNLGHQFYKQIISGDLDRMPMYTSQNHVSFGFSSLIINKLKKLHEQKKNN
jgi:hypothetical protein